MRGGECIYVDAIAAGRFPFVGAISDMANPTVAVIVKAKVVFGLSTSIFQKRYL
jgi:hypothetical protein